MTLANWITSIRFVLAPLIFWQLSGKTTEGLQWALVLIAVAGLTDVLDGYAARSRNEVSELGKMLDPLADKLLILLILLAMTLKWGLPGWLVLIYLVKESAQVLAGAYALKKRSQLIPANRWGKSATFAFFVGFGLFLLNRWVGTAVLIIAVGLSIYAFYTYYRTYQAMNQQG